MINEFQKPFSKRGEENFDRIFKVKKFPTHAALERELASARKLQDADRREKRDLAAE